MLGVFLTTDTNLVYTLTEDLKSVQCRSRSD